MPSCPAPEIAGPRALLLGLALATMLWLPAAIAGDGEIERDPLRDAVVTFDRYACPSGWIQFGVPVRRLAERPRRSRATAPAPELFGRPAPAAAEPAVQPVPAPPIAAKARFGLVRCKKL